MDDEAAELILRGKDASLFPFPEDWKLGFLAPRNALMLRGKLFFLSFFKELRDLLLDDDDDDDVDDDVDEDNSLWGGRLVGDTAPLLRFERSGPSIGLLGRFNTKERCGETRGEICVESLWEDCEELIPCESENESTDGILLYGETFGERACGLSVTPPIGQSLLSVAVGLLRGILNSSNIIAVM